MRRSHWSKPRVYKGASYVDKQRKSEGVVLKQKHALKKSEEARVTKQSG